MSHQLQFDAAHLVKVAAASHPPISKSDSKSKKHFVPVTLTHDPSLFDDGAVVVVPLSLQTAYFALDLALGLISEEDMLDRELMEVQRFHAKAKGHFRPCVVVGKHHDEETHEVIYALCPMATFECSAYHKIDQNVRPLVLPVKNGGLDWRNCAGRKAFEFTPSFDWIGTPQYIIGSVVHRPASHVKKADLPGYEDKHLEKEELDRLRTVCLRECRERYLAMMRPDLAALPKEPTGTPRALVFVESELTCRTVDTSYVSQYPTLRHSNERPNSANSGGKRSLVSSADKGQSCSSAQER